MQSECLFTWLQREEWVERKYNHRNNIKCKYDMQGNYYYVAIKNAEKKIMCKLGSDFTGK